VPAAVMFATKPSGLLDRAQILRIRAAFMAGYGMVGRELCRGIRQREMGTVMAVRADHALTKVSAAL
jgi:hypothetical protein